MLNRKIGNRLLMPLVFGTAAVMLAGCETASFRVVDESKAMVSASIKEDYAKADVLGTIAIQKRNLDALLAEEMRVVQENLNIQRDISLLELADNSTPMAVTWKFDIAAPAEKLGLTLAGLRHYVAAGDLYDLSKARLGELANRLAKVAGERPVCPVQGDVKKPDLSHLSGGKLRLAEKRFEKFQKTCSDDQKNLGELRAANKGSIGKAEAKFDQANARLAMLDANLKVAQKQISVATGTYEAAVAKVKKAGKKGASLRKAIKEEADKLTKSLETAAELSPEALPEERISAIMTFIGAGTGERGTVENDEKIQNAVLMVNGLTSLSIDLDGLIARSEAPAVSNLLIEMQHQTTLLEHAKEKRSIQQRRIEILETRYEAFREEASELLKFRDALCSFALLKGNPENHPGPACDGFTLIEIDSEADGMKKTQWECYDNGKKLENCALLRPWNEYLKRTQTGPAGREFYKSVTAFMRLFSIRASQVQQNFRLTDLKLRENLAAREAALKAWNNLAAAPIEQLDAYYQSGLTPEAIADVLVKALGFTAITVGVSQ